jgi:hypothetical protein
VKKRKGLLVAGCESSPCVGSGFSRALVLYSVPFVLRSTYEGRRRVLIGNAPGIILTTSRIAEAPPPPADLS